MAATLVGGAFLSASVQTLIEKLASTEFRDYITNRKLNVSLLRQLETTLLILQAVLNDAEEKQITNPAVKQWLDDLKDAIFDAEDLLNELSYDLLRCKVESKEAEKITNQVWNFLSSPFKTSYSEINSQMKNMCERLQLFAQHKDILGLQSVSGRVSRRKPTSSMVNQTAIVGRKNDKEKIMDMLLSDSGTGTNNIGVVTIFGMGGVGKTTLVQLLYNDKQVEKHFDRRAWICVSEDFDIVRVTKNLLESVTSKSWESDNLDLLQRELRENLRDKRCLFVLDDLWNDKYSDWEELVTPLVNRNAGSRVIVTTRQQKVAEFTHTFPIHKLEPLSDEDCWSLLSKHAFGNENFGGTNYPKLEAIGKKIAKKCGGLPIAAKTLGGLLRSKVDVKEWTTILNSSTWDLPNNDIVPALLLSYQYLPSPLKRCFAYCSIFPKDSLLDRKEMVLLWMAEGFLECSQSEKAVEEVGEIYFDELFSRSLIQPSNAEARREYFVMHDLVHDLAIIVSGNSCCQLERGKVSESARHLSYIQERYNISKKFEICYKLKCLRTFLHLEWSLHNFLSQKIFHDLLPTLKRLRVLSLAGYISVTMLPDSFGSLVQLRYLDISETRIKNLPDTICNLYNLQTLLMQYCRDLTVLPMHMGKLVNLRHLNISGTRIREMPKQIVELKNLVTLTVFAVGSHQVGLTLSDLTKFPHLKGNLSILNLHNVSAATEASDANLKGKEQIEELMLNWGKYADDSRTAKDVLNLLQPSANLKKLTINLYGGTSFPSWLGDSSFSNLVSLRISNCEYCIALPPLGQLLSLKDLIVSHMTLETIGPEFYGMAVGGSVCSFQPFPSLELLEFSDMSNWKEWIPFESDELAFPCLKYLNLNKCRKLRGHFPRHLPSIEKISVSVCDHLLETPHSLHWLSSIKKICINLDIEFMGIEASNFTCGQIDWSFLECDSQCLVEDVTIGYCCTLLSLPKMIVSSTCLQKLELFKIPSLTAFPEDGLPTSLQTLSIQECKNLAFLPREAWSNYTSLVTLKLRNSCDTLTCFPLDGFPALQSLSIRDCSSLESIFISESSPLCQSSLQSLKIGPCNALRSLPLQMDILTALQRLTLNDLPELDLSSCEGPWLPPNLRSLKFMRLPPLVITALGLLHLTALSDLRIHGDDIVNVLLKGRLLPISLVNLDICYLSHTKSLEENGLQYLSSLKSLHFQDCPSLESLPEDRLPSSLKILRIWGYPLLKARYESQREESWSNIAHIPVLQINGDVYEPGEGKEKK